MPPLPELAGTDHEQALHRARHRNVHPVGAAQEANPSIRVVPDGGQDDDTVFLALIAVHGVDLDKASRGPEPWGFGLQLVNE